MAQAENLPVVLITPYYEANSADRQRELKFCLQANVNCRAISKIILVIDDDSEPPIESEKISVVRISQRPTYRYWINISKQLGYPHISVLSNSDIYFDDTAEAFETCLTDDRSFVALSRYEKIGNKLEPHPDPHWSQDVWAIRHPVDLSDSFLQSLEIPLGVPRCDNRIAYIFKINGWRVVNPFGAIIAGHAHETQIRTYDKKRDTTIIGGVAYVHPCEPSGTSDIDIDVWMLDDANVKSLKINKWLMQWHSEPRPQPAVKETTRPTASPVRQEKLKSNGQTAQIAKLEKQRDLTPIKPVLDIDIAIKQYSKGSGDPHFWQYPCFTEKQAFENHDTIPVGSHIDERTRTVHTYLALPWATYIDLQAPINETLDAVRKRVNSARKTAHQAGYRLRVHTVCQHYAWHRLKSAFSLVGVTDLHLAHCTSTLLAESRPSFRFHSWPLFAPNIENSHRSRGTQVGIHPKKKLYLASFIGSHMKHYRSETRLALEHAAIADGGSDILVELTSIWHFNQSVYDEQVKGKTLSADSHSQQLQAAERYNRLLSNSVFSLCPDGAGPNTLRTWESLAVGSIPVIIADDWAPPNLNGRDLSDACLFVERSDIPTLFDRLRSIPDAELAERMRACFDCYFAARNMTAFGAHDFEEMENSVSAKAARNSNNLVGVPA